MNMKLLALFPLVLIVTVTALDQEALQKAKQDVMKVGTQCVTKGHVGSDDINRFLAHKLPKTHEGFCVISCVQKHFGFQKEDGTFSRDVLENQMEIIKDDKELYDTAFSIYDDVCSKLPFGEDDCENAVQMVKCFIKEGEQRGLPMELYKF